MGMVRDNSELVLLDAPVVTTTQPGAIGLFLATLDPVREVLTREGDLELETLVRGRIGSRASRE